MKRGEAKGGNRALFRDAGSAHLGRVMEVAGVGLVVIDARTPVDGVVAADAVEGVEAAVVPPTAVHHVAADDPRDDVAPGAAERLVVAAATVHEVEVRPTADGVISVLTFHAVAAGAAVQPVAAKTAEQ